MDEYVISVLKLIGVVVLTVVISVGVIAIGYSVEDDGQKNEVIKLNYGDEVRTMEICGEKHQYLLADRGVCHLPNCKYCKPPKIHPSDFR